MKIELPNELVSDVVDQLASTRDVQREKRGNTVEWDRSALGRLYSMLVQELGNARRRGTSANRNKARSRFRR